MQKRGMWAAGLAGVMITGMGEGRAARAAEDPLLVVVEAQPGLGVDAADVRRRIASELHQAVVSPSDPAAPRASQVLIVSLDEADIRISMRSGASAHVSRTIPDVAERAARLRAVAWLAGNLARDQVGPLLPKLALAAAPEPAKAAPTAAAQAPATTTPAIVEPPPVGPAPWPSTDAAVSARASASSADANTNARWMITATGGVTFTASCLQIDPSINVTCGGVPNVSRGFGYQFEVQHQSPGDDMILGGALDAGPDPHVVGIAAFIGTRRSSKHWYLEATLGAGIEDERLPVGNYTITNSSQNGTSSETTFSTGNQPALYARAIGSIGVPINSTFDFVARLGLHLASSGLNTDFMVATAGLRVKLP